MPRFKSLFLGAWVAGALPFAVMAQPVWVQIEALPTLEEAQSRAAEFDFAQDNVAGFALQRGWYAIALGPYENDDAEALLRRLRSSGAIPSDSYISDGDIYGNQFYPVGRGVSLEAQPLPGSPDSNTETVASTEQPVVEAPAPIELTPADETPREARESESALSRDEKRLLQTALQWSGHYSGAIDGLYGRGTRRSMESWQAANGHEETGILTTAQRAQLLAAYNAVLDGMDLTQVSDEKTGIQMQLPLGVVAFDHYDAPFAHFDARGDLDARVLLISQAGDRETLAGLYEILQTLEIVPREGERRLRRDSFKIEGVSARRHTVIQAGLEDGQIKGFALVWPSDDEERRSRVLDEMRKSYSTFGGTLDPNLISDTSRETSDLVSGLAIRKPILSRTGFFVTEAGDVATYAPGLEACGLLTIDGEVEMTLNHTDADLGVALLRPTQEIAPRGVARLADQAPRANSDVALAGFPYGGVLPVAALTFGQLEALSSLQGDTRYARLSLEAEIPEYGGPVMDQAGRVFAMLAPVEGAKQLPQGVAFALRSAPLAQTLSNAGLTVAPDADFAARTPEDITREAIKTTVLVRCWE